MAAVVLYALVTLPPRTAALGHTVPETDVYGAYHIHSARSDGSGSVDEIAAAAARAGLKFIILTDHGDATRVPDPPAYRSGVLCIDAVELNTTSGHVVALNLPGAAPYPLAGDAREVIDDVHRLGGFAILAHPDSPKTDLSWRDWSVPWDGIEWINADSEWRRAWFPTLAGTVVRSMVRAPEAIAALFTPPMRTLQRWDMASLERPRVALAALDAHARLGGWDSQEEPKTHTILHVPSYESLFRTLAQVAVLDRPLDGMPRQDAARVLDAITHGRTFSIVRGFAGPASLEFTAWQNGAPIAMGGTIADATGPVEFRAVVPEAPRSVINLVHDGRPIRTGQGRVDWTGVPSPGAYRVEVMYPGFAVPWIVSNAISVSGPMQETVDPGARPAAVSRPIAPDDSAWHIEKDVTSVGISHPDGGGLDFTYQLGAGTPAGQYAALAVTFDTAVGADRIQFVGRADRPMRVSVQVRLAGARETARWRHSVYLDQSARPIVLRLSDFEPVDGATQLRPNAARVTSLLFVVDTVNSKPGTAGAVHVSAVALGASQPDGSGRP